MTSLSLLSGRTVAKSLSTDYALMAINHIGINSVALGIENCLGILNTAEFIETEKILYVVMNSRQVKVYF